MDQLFDNFGFRGLAPSGAMGSVWSPQIEMFDRGGQLVVRADLPGLKQGDVRVHLEEDALVIEGERRDEREDEREGFYHSERSYGSFQRVVPLPSDVDPESIKASFEHGVLEVTMPLPKEKARGRKIEIRTSGETSGATKQGSPTKGRPS